MAGHISLHITKKDPKHAIFSFHITKKDPKHGTFWNQTPGKPDPYNRLSFWTLCEGAGRRKFSHMSDLSTRIGFSISDEQVSFGRRSKVLGGVSTHKCRNCKRATFFCVFCLQGNLLSSNLKRLQVSGFPGVRFQTISNKNKTRIVEPVFCYVELHAPRHRDVRNKNYFFVFEDFDQDPKRRLQSKISKRK